MAKTLQELKAEREKWNSKNTKSKLSLDELKKARGYVAPQLKEASTNTSDFRKVEQQSSIRTRQDATELIKKNNPEANQKTGYERFNDTSALTKLATNLQGSFVGAGQGRNQLVKDVHALFPIKEDSFASKIGITPELQQQAVKGIDEQQRKADKYQQSLQPTLSKQNTAEQILYGALGQAPQFLGMALQPAASIAQMGIGAGGQKSKEVQDKGGSLAQGVGAGIAKGSLETGLGMLSALAFKNVLLGGGAKALAKEVGTEALEEGATQALDPIINKASIPNYKMPSVGQQVSDVAIASAQGALGGLLFGGGTNLISKFNTAKNNPTQENIQALGEAVEQAPNKKEIEAELQRFFTEQAKTVQSEPLLEGFENPNFEKVQLEKARNQRITEEAQANQFEPFENPNYFNQPTQETVASPEVNQKDMTLEELKAERMKKLSSQPIKNATINGEVETVQEQKVKEQLLDDSDVEAMVKNFANKASELNAIKTDSKTDTSKIVSAQLETVSNQITQSENNKNSLSASNTEPLVVMNEDIGIPKSDISYSSSMTLESLMSGERKAVGAAIDTKSKVLTENPQKLKASLSEKAERAYQEIFSTNVPFERMDGDARIQGSNLNRTLGSIEYSVVGKQTNMTGKEIGKSVVDIFSDVDTKNKQDLFDYILNTHNIDRWNEAKPVFGDTIDADRSNAILEKYNESNPEFADKQKEITKYFTNLLDSWSVKSGLVSKEMADLLKERYPNYVPTYRAKDFPKNMISNNQNVAQMIKKAKGGESSILPIDQQMVAMTERTIKNARKNELMNTIAELYEENDPKAMRYISNITDSTMEKVDDFLDIGMDLDIEPVQKGNEYLVNFYTDGVPRQMTVNKTLYKALEVSQTDSAIYEIAKFFKRYATNPFKALITGYNPLFGASNVVRDIPTALVFSDNPTNMAKNVPFAVKEMLTNGEKFRIFKALGGTRDGLIGSGKEFKVPSLNESKKVFKIAQKMNPIKTVGDVNNFTETLPRFSEFLNVLEKTGDPALAIYKSAELTTDFSRSGKLTKLIDNFVPYLNPSVQGLDKFARTVKQSPIKMATRGFMAITIPTILLDLFNKDDDEYNNLTARERNLYFNIPFIDKEGNKKFVRLPKSRELGVIFSSTYEWAARASRGQEVTGEEISQAIAENFSPADVGSKIWTPAVKAWKQIQNPDAYETNFWGGLIVPTSQRKYSPGEQYDLNSSGIAKAIGKEFDISPYVIDYVMYSYGGIINSIVQPIGADRKYSALAPIKNKFINDPVYKSAAVEKFYTVLDKTKKAAQDYNKVNNVPSEVVTKLEKEANYFNKTSLKLSDMRKELKLLQQQKGTEIEARNLQAAMNKVATEAVEKYNIKHNGESK